MIIRPYRPYRRSTGRQVVHPCGQHRNAPGTAIRAADQMQPPSNERLPFGRAGAAACALAHLATALDVRPAAYRRGEAIDDEPVARGDHLPRHL